jgi:hypothetical protein
VREDSSRDLEGVLCLFELVEGGPHADHFPPVTIKR